MGASLDDKENEEGHVSVYWVSGGADPIRRFVTLEQSGRIFLTQGDNKDLTCIHLTPKQFLELLDWGATQRGTLEAIVNGNESIEDEFPGLIEFLNGGGHLPLPLIPEGQDIYWRGKRVSPEQMSKAHRKAKEGKHGNG